ncbi:MAG: D-2-hydroxyacid dehydrogenase [Acidimicrobiales bacterium]
MPTLLGQGYPRSETPTVDIAAPLNAHDAIADMDASGILPFRLLHVPVGSVGGGRSDTHSEYRGPSEPASRSTAAGKAQAASQSQARSQSQSQSQSQVGDAARLFPPAERAGAGSSASEPASPHGWATNLDGVQVLWRYGMTASELTGVLEAMPDIRWIHSDYVGVDDLPLAEIDRRGILLTNGAGTFANPMAEWIVLALLAAAKHLLEFARRSDSGIWDADTTLAELDGKKALLLGLGATGTRAAELLAPFGVELVGSARRRRDYLPTGLSRLVLGDGWRTELASSDFVICTLPLTPATRGIIDTVTLEAMKPGSWLVNVARGDLVDEQALVGALDSGHLGGAVLDAFAQEPLPTDNPLWRRDNVLVLPHHTWSSDRVLQRYRTLFANQLRRFVAGEPLSNVVDLTAGY